MKLAEGIRRHGFRKWYERELLQSHAHLALTFICVVGVFAALEAAFRYRTLADRLFDVMAVFVCAATGVWALRRYLFLLTHAEAVAHQADCPQCQAYGRLELLQSDASGQTVQVRCLHCGHVWRIDG
jgi:predicted Zn finger-like uncharacterized protein